jgi:hypothetical protein
MYEELNDFTPTGRLRKRSCLKCDKLYPIIHLRKDGICENCLKSVTKERIIEELRTNCRWNESTYGWCKSGGGVYDDTYELRFAEDKIHLRTSYHGSCYADRGHRDEEFDYTIGDCAKYLTICINDE